MTAQALQSGDKPVDKILRWLALRPGLILMLVVLAALGPFITKPFNIDDPLFLWTARQIQAHPANPYGFDVNWYGTISPMWEVTKNPPLAAYYLAMAAAVLGWSEPALHLAFLLPAIAAILGTYRLARRFCNRPMLAACATLFTPVFLVSSTTLMGDTLMLAFWVWAVVLWVEGMERNNLRRLTGSGVLIALAALTKYFGVCLIPLLAAYSIIGQRRIGRWAGCFLVPVTALAAYQWATYALYGKGLLSDTGDYVTTVRGSSGIYGAVAGLMALTFTGGCLAIATFLAPWLWRTRTMVVLATGAALIAVAVFLEGTMLGKTGPLAGTSPAFLAVQIVFWAIGGLSVLGLAVADAWHRRDARTYLLALWVLGTFLFAAFFNWIVNARSILPMAPAVGILLARRLEAGALAGRKIRQEGVLICLVAGAVLALWVTRADFILATAVRQSAEQTRARCGQGGETLWFEGHWGFQYYMERLGAKAVVAKQSVPKQGDFLAIPPNNSNTSPPDNKQAHPWKAFLTQGPRWITTTSKEVGAGFYTSTLGPLPFAFGHVPPETVLVYVLGSMPPTSPVNQP
jgi:4-amino-4-deoxy-L-arabinose transferase-like glycosyltransferase